MLPERTRGLMLDATSPRPSLAVQKVKEFTESCRGLMPGQPEIGELKLIKIDVRWRRREIKRLRKEEKETHARARVHTHTNPPPPPPNNTNNNNNNNNDDDDDDDDALFLSRLLLLTTPVVKLGHHSRVSTSLRHKHGGPSRGCRLIPEE